MNNRLTEIFGTRTVLCDGAMGTSLYARGVFINRCYDELNLSQPEMVRTIHEEYLQAGAEIIETNTFGANALRLQRYGLGDRVAEINRAGAELARKAVNQLAEKQAERPGLRAPSVPSVSAWSRWGRSGWMRRAKPLPSRFAGWPRAASTCW